MRVTLIALQTDEQITPITTIKRHGAAAGRVRHRPRSFEDRGGRSPLIIKDLDLYPQPPTNTRSPTLNSEEPLMLQFPPFARAGTTATPSSAPPSPLARASNATPPQPRPHGAASPAAPGNNAPGARGPPSWPHPVACPLSHRPPAHTTPPNGGFCTIRRIATACHRRVAPLMLQFPPVARANRRLASCTGPRPVACPPSHRSPGHTPPPTGGFAPLDASLRRVAGVSHP